MSYSVSAEVSDAVTADHYDKEYQLALEEIKKETDSMKDVWETKTSEGVYNDFEHFYKLGESVVSVNESDSKFLNAVVKANYVNFDDSTNKLVDSNIAI